MARVAITKEIGINTDGNAKRTKFNHRASAAQIRTDGMPQKDYSSKEQVRNNGAIHIRMSRSLKTI
jgi:hypothetical protein